MAKGSASASSAFKRISTLTKGSFKKSQKKEAKVKGASLPDGITRGVARLKGMKSGVGKNEQKTPYIMLECIAQEPDTVRGTKFFLSYFFAKGVDPKTKEVYRTIEDVVDSLVSDLKIICGEEAVEQLDMDADLEKAIKSLCKDEPYFYYNTWKPKKRKGDKNEPQVKVFPQGHIEEYEGPEDEEIEEDEDEENEEVEEEEEDEEEEKKPRSSKKPNSGKKPSRKKKEEEPEEEEEEEDEETEEEEEEESEEEEFDTSLVYGYKVGKKVEDVEIVKHYPKTNKVDIKILSSKKAIKGIKIDDLTDAND